MSSLRGALPFPHVSLSAVKPKERPYPKELNTVGDHIKKRRLDLGLYQKEAAKLIGVSEDAVCKWEKNETAMRAKNFPGVISFLGYIPFEIGETPSEQLFAYRRIRGITHRELAKEWGIERGCLERWEGGATPRKENFQDLIDGIADRLIAELGLRTYSEFIE